MIPTVQEILMGLLNGSYTAAQAERWINTHIELGGEAADLADLRDHFAASALQTMQLANSWSDNPLYWEGVAKSAYVCADAMLAARTAA